MTGGGEKKLPGRNRRHEAAAPARTAPTATRRADAPSPPALANHASRENTNSANTRQPHTHAPGRRHARAHAAEAAAMPMPSACRISEAAAICVATELGR